MMNNASNITKIEQALSRYVHQDQQILVAFSGGVDSTVLLHALNHLKAQYALTLRAIYIHHGISSNADSWAMHCQQICQQWQIPLHIEKVQIKLSSNIEAQAREARYQAIKSNLKPNEIVMTAQHQDDQCETFLLALKRGSGPTGLSAMPDSISFKKSKLIRPLLSVSREDIELYAVNYQLNWIEDESNQDTHYDRNFLRRNVLPLLNQRWPHFNQMVSRSAELCAEETQLITELLSEQLHRNMDDEHNLHLAELITASNVKRNALLRSWLKYHAIEMPSRQQLNLLWQTVVLAKEDANPVFTLNSHTVRRYQNRLYLLPKQVTLDDIIIDWDISAPLPLPDNLGSLRSNKSSRGQLRAPMEHEKVTVRFCANGRFHIVGRQGSRPIKKLWQEHGIAPWMRTRTPLIYYNDHLIAAVGVFITTDGRGHELEITQYHE